MWKYLLKSSDFLLQRVNSIQIPVRCTPSGHEGCRLLSAKGGLMGTKKVGALSSRLKRTILIISQKQENQTKSQENNLFFSLAELSNIK
jgi:hypothetical protein